MLVIDASATLYVLSSTDGFTIFQGEEVVAPPLMWSETLAVLHRAMWHGSTSARLATAARDRLLTAPISAQRPQELYLEAWRVADLLGWARTYDAEYVALARLLNCRLLTVDERLSRGAARAVQLVGPDKLH